MVNYRKRIYDKNKRSLNYWILRNAKKIKAIHYLGGKCQNCGCDDFQCLEFHHDTIKDSNISKIVGSKSWDNIEKEIKKCKLLCGNCHSELHYTDKETKNKEIKRILFEQLGYGRCEKCGYDKCYSALHFHHTDPSTKEYKISDIRNLNESLLSEVRKCQVLCSNCHKKDHFNQKKFLKYRDEIIKKSENLKKVNKEIDRSKILKLHDEGMKQIDISRTLKCSPSVVCQVLKEHRNFYEEKINDEKVKRMYIDDGLNPHRISKILNRAPISIIRSLKRSKVYKTKLRNKNDLHSLR